MRAHKAGPSEPYEFGLDVEATAKHYTQLRYRLLPYIYTAARETATTGLPLLRPLVLEFQDDPGSATAKTEFMFGHDLLVAPVIWANTKARQVYFPAGHWISYDDGFEVTGGQSIGVSAPRDRIPLFVRAGAILPTAPDMMFSGEKPWDPVTLDIWPAGDTTGSLYQDDNATQAYARGEFTTTTFRSVETPGKSIDFSITPSNTKFGPARWIARFHLTSVPTSVALDGKAATAWQYDPTNQILTVNLPGQRQAHRVVVALDGSVHARPSAPHVDAPPVDEVVETAPVRQLPQFLPAPILPVRIDAANYDKGGEGLAFHVAAPAKTVIYRQDGVPIVTSTDSGGGYAIQGLQQGDWLSYTIDAGAGGWFGLSVRARAPQGGSLDILKNRFIRLTGVDFPASGKWSAADASPAFYLPPGEQIITAQVRQPGFDLGSLNFTRLPQAVTTAEAEDGHLANAGTNADHPGFSGTGFVAGLSEKSQSVTLDLSVPKSGRYLVALRYANGGGDAQVSLTVAGVTQTVPLRPTNGWEGYEEAGQVAALPAGHQTIVIAGAGSGVINLDRVSLIPIP